MESYINKEKLWRKTVSNMIISCWLWNKTTNLKEQRFLEDIFVKLRKEARSYEYYIGEPTL